MEEKICYQKILLLKDLQEELNSFLETFQWTLFADHLVNVKCCSSNISFTLEVLDHIIFIYLCFTVYE